MKKNRELLPRKRRLQGSERVGFKVITVREVSIQKNQRTVAVRDSVVWEVSVIPEIGF